MVVLPPGAFTMGPAPGEDDREDMSGMNDAEPAHRVDIGYSFAMGKYEVTSAEFTAFVIATGRQTENSCWGYNADGHAADIPGRSWCNPGFAQTDRNPAVCVSWDDAKAYVEWLRQTTGKAYRLPSEAEWEYAARAGSQASRYWGELREPSCRYGNFADFTAASALNWPRTSEFIFSCSDGYVYPAPVGTFQPNAFGLYDMLGNAAEWTEDCYNRNYNGAPVDGGAWLADNCNLRMLRGGSWHLSPGETRAAFRSRAAAAAHDVNAGFRVARTN
jgi:formylglycine-generating enzyme required for sulfatase activity